MEYVFLEANNWPMKMTVTLCITTGYWWTCFRMPLFIQIHYNIINMGEVKSLKYTLTWNIRFGTNHGARLIKHACSAVVSLMPGMLYAKGKSPKNTLNNGAEWDPEPVWKTWRRENFLTLPHLELWPLSFPAYSQLLNWLHYPNCQH